MSISARDLFFVLRAKDEATGTLDRVGRDLLRVGVAAEAASARANAAALRQRAELMKSTGATRAQIDAVNASARAWDEHARKLEADFQQHQRVTAAVKTTSDVLAGVGIGLIGVGAATLAALGTTVQAAQEYQRTVALTKTQVDGFSASLQDLSKAGLDVANNVAAPFEEIQPTLYNIFSSTNANLQQGITLLNAFARTAVAGQVSIDQASKGTMAILNGFSLPFEKVNSILDIQFQLVRKGVGTYSDFNSVLGRIIPSANRAGQNFQTVAAMLAFMTRNGLSAAMAATSGARALDAFSNPVAVKNLEKMGITMRDATGALKPLPDILTQLRDKIMQLPAADRVQALSDAFKGAGGNIQAMRFINEVIDPMHQASTQLQNFLGFMNDMNNASGQFDQAYATMADTTAAKTQLLKNRWDVLKETVGELITPAFTDLLGALDDLLGRFNSLPDSTKKSIVNAALVVAAISLIGGTALLAAAGVGYLAAALAAVGIELGPALAIILAVGLAIAGIGAFFRKAWEDSKPFRDFIKQIGRDIKSFWDDILHPFIFNIQFYYYGTLKPALDNLQGTLEKNVLPVLKEFYDWFTPKRKKDLKEIADFIQKELKGAFQFLADLINNVLIPILKDLQGFWDKHKTGIKEVADKAEWLWKQIAKLAGTTGFGLLMVVLAGVILAVSAVLAVLWALAEAINFVVHMVSNIVGAIEWLINKVREAGKWFDSLGTSMSNAFSHVESLLQSIPGRIAGVFANIGGLLISAGESVMNGFIQGVKNKVQDLINLLSAVTALVALHKGPPEVDKKLLYRSGQYVMQGFMRGIDSTLPTLRSQLSGITARITPTVNATSTTSHQLVPAGHVTYLTQNITVNQADRPVRQLGIELGNQLHGSIK